MLKDDQRLDASVDYNLHRIVGVRLLNATPREVELVTRQLGPIQAFLSREPDIVIRFVDHLPLSSPMRYLGLDDAGFTDDAFLVLRSKHKARARVQIPFAQIGQLGQPCEIVCERGLPAVPLLIPIVNLTALAKGFLPLHASAFRYQGAGVLATGWAKGGKTETLLAFMANGAEYVGDEWIYLSPDGQRMMGIPEPIRIWDWHLQNLPQYWALVRPRDRVRLRAFRLAAQAMERATTNPRMSASSPGKLFRRMTPLLQQQLYVHIPPQKLFGQAVGPLVADLHKIIFVASHESPTVAVQAVDPLEVARRMVFSLQEERLDFLSYYLKFRFAFPGECNELIEQAEERQRQLLLRLMANKETYAVYHPYPVAIPSLFAAIRPLL